MYEKLFAALLAKFVGIRKDALAQLAKSLSTTVDTEAEVTTYIEKLTPEKVDAFVKDFRKDIDKEVGEANRSFEATLKKKFDFVEKKDEQQQQQPEQGKPSDLEAVIAAALSKHLLPLQQKLESFQNEKISGSRVDVLSQKLVGVPDSFKAQKLKDFGRMKFDSDEDFNTYLAEVETDLGAFKQELASQGLAGQAAPVFGQKNQDGVSSAVASFVANSSAAKPSNLAGKEI